MNTGTLGNRQPEPARRSDGLARTKGSQRSWWPWAKRVLTLAFFALVVALLWRYAQRVDWDDVWSSVKETPRPALMIAIGLAVASHLLYSCFDLLGRRYTGHTLRTPLVMAISFISYAFNLTGQRLSDAPHGAAS